MALTESLYLDGSPAAQEIDQENDSVFRLDGIGMEE